MGNGGGDRRSWFNWTNRVIGIGDRHWWGTADGIGDRHWGDGVLILGGINTLDQQATANRQGGIGGRGGAGVGVPDKTMEITCPAHDAASAASSWRWRFLEASAATSASSTIRAMSEAIQFELGSWGQRWRAGKSLSQKCFGSWELKVAFYATASAPLII